MASDKGMGALDQGHADSGSPKESLSKGTYMQIGTTAPLAEKATSVDQKTGKAQDNEH
jgi:hypothetical protein